MSVGPAIAANNTDLLSTVAEGAEGAKVTEMTGTVEPAGVLQATEETSTSGQQLLELLLNLDNTPSKFFTNTAGFSRPSARPI